ncbi:putative uncharacterized protein DDB_G0294196 [Palaemon carinicauda]|uniref:putative uncharacterized protein DDB_G0294196 n=1 Tax=Palaemon carinicauda TaxID=392227 RepID=UPI0035B637CD
MKETFQLQPYQPIQYQQQQFVQQPYQQQQATFYIPQQQPVPPHQNLQPLSPQQQVWTPRIATPLYNLPSPAPACTTLPNIPVSRYVALAAIPKHLGHLDPQHCVCCNGPDGHIPQPGHSKECAEGR